MPESFVREASPKIQSKANTLLFTVFDRKGNPFQIPTVELCFLTSILLAKSDAPA